MEKTSFGNFNFMRIWVLLIMVCSHCVHAQNKAESSRYIDSVRSYINENRSTDPRGVFNVLQKIEKMDIDDERRSKTYLGLATTALDVGMQTEAKYYLDKHRALAIRMTDMNAMWYNYSNSGLYYFNIGDYDSAMLYYRKTIRVANDIGMPTTVVKGNIGLLYEIIKDPSSAIQYYSSALKEGIDSLNKPISMNNNSYRSKYIIALCNTAGKLTKLARQYNDPPSESYGREILEMLLSNFKDDFQGLNLLRLYETMGEVAFIENDFVKAKQYALSAFNLASSTQNQTHKFFAVDLLCRISLSSLGTVVSYNEGLSYSDSLGVALRQIDRVNLFLHRSLLYLKTNQIDSAITYYDKYLLFKGLDDHVVDLVKMKIGEVLPDELTTTYAADIEQIKVYSINSGKWKILSDWYYYILIITGGLIVIFVIIVVYHKKYT